MGNTKVEMVVTIIANMANIGFNAVFIYGRFGLPEMGAEGAGLGTLLSRIIAPILMIGYFYNRHKYRGYLDGFSPRNYSWATVKNLLHMGLPISMQMFLEASAFVGTGIMMGWFGKEYQATLVPVESDENGIIPEKLEKAMRQYHHWLIHDYFFGATRS